MDYFTDDIGNERFSFPTKQQKIAIEKRAKKKSFERASAEIFKRDKYGSSTTNWRQLNRRIERKDAGRTPMIFLGIPANYKSIEIP